jgi:hypothetical protein
LPLAHSEVAHIKVNFQRAANHVCVQNYATQSRAVPAAALCFQSAKVIIALEVGIFPAPPQFPPGGFGLSPSHSPSACHVRIALSLLLSRAAFRTAFFAFWKLSVLYDESQGGGTSYWVLNLVGRGPIRNALCVINRAAQRRRFYNSVRKHHIFAPIMKLGVD